jgi:hypothetical protein
MSQSTFLNKEEGKMKFSFLTYQFCRFPLEYSFKMAKYYGFDGILYAGPIADFMAFIVTLIMITIEFRRYFNTKQKFS